MGIGEVIIVLSSMIFSLLVINKHDRNANKKERYEYLRLYDEQLSMTNKPPPPPVREKRQYMSDEHFQKVSPPLPLKVINIHCTGCGWGADDVPKNIVANFCSRCGSEIYSTTIERK